MNNMQQLSLETLQFIDEKKREYEEKYTIRIYMWLVRKSFLRGLGRKSSDLDIAFIFDDLGEQKHKILFERSKRRVEIQCWNIRDILSVIVENKQRASKDRFFSLYYENQELKHYILDYYNGFYCGFDSGLAGDYYQFWERCGNSFKNMYEPLVVARMCYNDLKAGQERLEKGYWISLNEYLNAVWSGLAGCHMLSGGSPGNVEIIDLIGKYADSNDRDELFSTVHYFKKTIQKQSNYGNILNWSGVLKTLLDKLEKKIYMYEVQSVNVEQNILIVRNYLEENKR